MVSFPETNRHPAGSPSLRELDDFNEGGTTLRDTGSVFPSLADSCVARVIDRAYYITNLHRPGRYDPTSAGSVPFTSLVYAYELM